MTFKWYKEGAKNERKALIGEFLQDLRVIPTFEHDVQMFLLGLKKKWEKRKTQ
jgi:hypothetical protein